VGGYVDQLSDHQLIRGSVSWSYGRKRSSGPRILCQLLEDLQMISEFRFGLRVLTSGVCRVLTYRRIQLLVGCVAYTSILKVEAEHSCGSSVNSYKVHRRHIAHESPLQFYLLHDPGYTTPD
jgi:hypothetical protein